jgi:hypothetical protein
MTSPKSAAVRKCLGKGGRKAKACLAKLCGLGKSGTRYRWNLRFGDKKRALGCPFDAVFRRSREARR